MKLYDLSKLSILIVDDDRFMRNIVNKLLGGLGVKNVILSGGFDEALNILKDGPVDLIICDWDMGQRTGLDLLGHLRAGSLPDSRFTPFIMLTGNSTKRYVMRSRDAGVTEFLVKPISAKSLYARLVAIIENPRPFVRASGYFGPDRRRRQNEAMAEHRRRSSD